MKIYVITVQFLRDDPRSKSADIIPDATGIHVFTNAHDTFAFLNANYPLSSMWNLSTLRRDGWDCDKCYELVLTRLAGTNSWVVLEDSLGDEFDCSLEGRLTLKTFNV